MARVRRGACCPALLVLGAIMVGISMPTGAKPKRNAPRDLATALHDPGRLVRLGQMLDAKGNAAGAMDFYAQALAIDPNYAPALAAAGGNAMRRGAWEEAVGYLSRRAEAAPTDWQARLELGLSFAASGRRAEALAALAEAARLGAPAVVEAGHRGVALDLIGDPRAAQLAYAEALHAAPGDAATTRALSLSLAISGDYEAALQLLQPLAAKNDSQVRQTTALVYAISGRMAAAAEIAGEPFARAYARLSELDGRDKAVVVHLGLLPPPADVAQAPSTPAPPTAPAVEASETHIAAPASGVHVIEGLPPGVQAAGPAASTVRVTEGVPPAETSPTPEPVGTAAAPQSIDPAALTRAPRIWVQLGSTPDRRALPDAWRRIRRTSAGLVDAYAPVVQKAGPTNRLLVGPFDSVDAARALVKQLGARRVAALVNRTPAGAALEPLGAP